MEEGRELEKRDGSSWYNGGYSRQGYRPSSHRYGYGSNYYKDRSRYGYGHSYGGYNRNRHGYGRKSHRYGYGNRHGYNRYGSGRKYNRYGSYRTGEFPGFIGNIQTA